MSKGKKTKGETNAKIIQPSGLGKVPVEGIIAVKIKKAEITEKIISRTIDQNKITFLSIRDDSFTKKGKGKKKTELKRRMIAIKALYHSRIS
jgi:hypothetical protein